MGDASGDQVLSADVELWDCEVLPFAKFWTAMIETRDPPKLKQFFPADTPITADAEGGKNALLTPSPHSHSTDAQICRDFFDSH